MLRIPLNNPSLRYPRSLGKNLPIERYNLHQQFIHLFAHHVLGAVGELNHRIGGLLKNLNEIMVEVKDLPVQP
jgi:hypothetical protein